MTLHPHAPRRWLACAGLAAAAVGGTAGVAGWSGPPPFDAPPALAPVVLPTPGGLAAPGSAASPVVPPVAGALPAPDGLAAAGAAPGEVVEDPVSTDPYVYTPSAATPTVPAQTAVPAQTTVPAQTAVPTPPPPLAGPASAAPVGRDPFLPLDVPPPPPAAADTVLSRLLTTGDRGEDVRQVQQALVDRFWGLTVDGVYGARTTAAVAGFQSEHALVVDGVVGPLTWTALTTSAAG